MEYMVRVIIKNISISGSSFVKERERNKERITKRKKKMMLKVLSTTQPNSSENRPDHTVQRWPNGLAQREFLQTLLIIGLFLFTVKEKY